MKYLVIIKTTLILVFCSFASSQLEGFQRMESFQYCNYDLDCNDNSFCFGNDGKNTGRCRCKDKYILVDRNKTYYECVLVAEGVDSPCTKDIQCQVNLGLEASCGEANNACRCSEGAHLGDDNRCYKTVALGELCTSNLNCLLIDRTYGFCVVGKCTCNLEHHVSEDGQRCVPSVALGKSCKTSESCIHTYANCFGGICKCMAGYIESDDNSICWKAASTFGEPCTENIQCSEYLKGASCRNGVCNCKSAHHGYGNECVLDAKLGEQCNSDKECILNAELEHSVHCADGICECVEGVSDQNSYGCVVVSDAVLTSKPFIFLLEVGMILTCIGHYF